MIENDYQTTSEIFDNLINFRIQGTIENDVHDLIQSD